MLRCIIIVTIHFCSFIKMVNKEKSMLNLTEKDIRGIGENRFIYKRIYMFAIIIGLVLLEMFLSSGANNYRDTSDYKAINGEEIITIQYDSSSDGNIIVNDIEYAKVINDDDKAIAILKVFSMLILFCAAGLCIWYLYKINNAGTKFIKEYNEENKWTTP